MKALSYESLRGIDQVNRFPRELLKIRGLAGIQL
jgi:hypothetical protein